MKRFFIMTLIISMFALAGCTTTTDDGNTTPDSENTSQENTNQNDQNTENENKNEENDTPAQPTLTGSTLDSITIKTPPAKTEYTAGETFDPAGLALTANYTDTYSDQSTKPSAKDLAYVDIQNDLTFTGTDFAAAGTKTVTVTYKGKNATFDVTVKEVPEQNIDIDYADDIDISGYGENINLTINVKTENIDLAKLSALKTTSNAKTLTFSIPEETKVQLDASYINGTNNNIIDGNYGNIVVVNTKGKDAGDGFQYTSTEISISNETELVLTGNFSIPALSIENKNISRAINMQDVTIVDTILANGADVPFPMPVTTSDLIDTFNNLLPSGQTMSPVLESHPKVLYTAFSSLPQLALKLNMENVSDDSKLKNQYINILKEYYDNDKAKLNDLDVINARDFYVNGREGKAVDDIVGLYDEKNNFNNPDDPKCTTPTTLPVYDVGFLHFSDTQGVGGFQNIVVTGDVASGTTIDLDFTNVVFTGDVSGIDNTGIYRGVIHFKDEPMKALYSSNTLIKIDKIPTGDRAFISGDILDFRDLTGNLDYDIGQYLHIGAHNDGRGYFASADQRDDIEPKIVTEVASFLNGTYVTTIPEEEKYMKTLREIEDAANGKGEYTLTELLRVKHDTVTRTE